MGSKKALGLILLISIILSGSIYLSAADSLSAFNAADITTYDAVSITAELGPAAIGTLSDTLENGEFSQRWAALMALHWIAYKTPGARPETFAIIDDYLNDDDPTIRFKAAEILAYYGDKNGLPVLIEFLETDEAMPLSEPPVTFAGRAQHLLHLLTDQYFGSIDEGNEWWNANENSLSFNEETGKFE